MQYSGPNPNNVTTQVKILLLALTTAVSSPPSATLEFDGETRARDWR
jgi:hypothetical protein